MVADADRINHRRDVTAMVASDTVAALADRVERLVTSGRRISVMHSYPEHPGSDPSIAVGLTLAGPVERWERDGVTGISVKLQPGLTAGFGFSAHVTGESEAQVWERWYSDPDDRRSIVQVAITGGLPNDGPARDDKLVIRRWNSAGVQVMLAVGFDYGPVDVEYDPMPRFTILGKDRLAPEAIAAYRELCIAAGLTGQAAQVQEAVIEIVQWQQRNARVVKDPDHGHVPAGNDRAGS